MYSFFVRAEIIYVKEKKQNRIMVKFIFYVPWCGCICCCLPVSSCLKIDSTQTLMFNSSEQLQKNIFTQLSFCKPFSSCQTYGQSDDVSWELKTIFIVVVVVVVVVVSLRCSLKRCSFLRFSPLKKNPNANVHCTIAWVDWAWTLISNNLSKEHPQIN